MTVKIKRAQSDKDVIISKQKDCTDFCVDGSPEQRKLVCIVIDTIIKYFNNDEAYRPIQAIVIGCGGTGNSYIINTIITMVRSLTSCNDTVQVASPSGCAAFNVKGSTIH